ncbi:hypothetical protein ACFT9I_07330 [Streptomyces sp. NPDC057137]|uniref:hypothetical protein n=1 Tax=Streptomyces sp. NPDC057137 TaxID=3346030 RepID=UPI003633FBD2
MTTWETARRRWWRVTTVTAGALAAVLVAGSGVLPGGQGEAVAAVRNSPPERIVHELMSTVPGGGCGWGEARTYAAELPQLRVEARDPDNVPPVADKVMVQFRVAWQDGAGAERSYTYDTGYKSPTPGTPFTHYVTQPPSGEPQIPSDAVIRWDARAYDGEAWGPWSSDGASGRCEVVLDSVGPGKPAVESARYPDDDVWHPGGEAGTFTFTAADGDSDVAHFRYTFLGETTKTVVAGADGTASVSWTPNRAGRWYVEVQAFDAAWNVSARTDYEFLVS